MEMDSFKTYYLLGNIESINDKFIIEPLENPVIGILNLPKSKQAVLNAWKITGMESSDGEDFEIIPVNLESYDPKIHKKKFDFAILEKSLNIEVFITEITNNILEKEIIFKEELNKNFLNAKTDFEIKHLLKEYIELIENVADNLNSLEANKIQKIVISLYQESYERVLEYLRIEFQKDYPELFTSKLSVVSTNEDDSLELIFFPDNIREFKELEQKLLRRDFLENKNGRLQWNESKGYKVKLINFCRILEDKKMSRPNIKISKIIKILENRYSIDVGDQRKKNKYGKLSLAEADFYFLFN